MTSTTTSTSVGTDTTPIKGVAGSFAAQVAGQWNVAAGTGMGENMNVMLNSDQTSATIVVTNNEGTLVLRVVTGTIDEANNTIDIGGNIGTLDANGDITFPDGTVWKAGPAAVTTTTQSSAATTASSSSASADPYAPGGSSDSSYSGSSGSSSDSSYGGSSGSSGSSSDSSYGGSSSSGSDSAGSGSYSGMGGYCADGSACPTVGQTCASDGSTCTAPSGGGGTGMISGDPHVMVKAPGQARVCYDVHGDELDYVSLLYDPNLELEINGQLTHVKWDKSRLSAIGFKV